MSLIAISALLAVILVCFLGIAATWVGFRWRSDLDATEKEIQRWREREKRDGGA